VWTCESIRPGERVLLRVENRKVFGIESSTDAVDRAVPDEHGVGVAGSGSVMSPVQTAPRW
jgi:hypothetical protein